MRKAALLFVIAVCAYAANAQFTIRPQAGFEFPSTKISYNNLPYFTPECQTSGQLGVRADYQFKGGFGPFAGVVTHNPMVGYHFSDPMTGMTEYSTTQGNLMAQLQAGLQYSSKPISLSKKSSKKSTAENAPKKEEVYYSRCGMKYTKASCSAQKNNWSLRLQPSAGIGYVPSDKDDLEIENGRYTYNAGNISTEFIGGMGFEFSRNKKKFATLSVNYFTGLSKSETSFTTQLAGGKEETTVLRSKVSGWNTSIGIPLTFTKKATTKKTAEKRQSCGSYYKSRCGY